MREIGKMNGADSSGIEGSITLISPLDSRFFSIAPHTLHHHHQFHLFDWSIVRQTKCSPYDVPNSQLVAETFQWIFHQQHQVKESTPMMWILKSAQQSQHDQTMIECVPTYRDVMTMRVGEVFFHFMKKTEKLLFETKMIYEIYGLLDWS